MELLLEHFILSKYIRTLHNAWKQLHSPYLLLYAKQSGLCGILWSNCPFGKICYSKKTTMKRLFTGHCTPIYILYRVKKKGRTRTICKILLKFKCNPLCVCQICIQDCLQGDILYRSDFPSNANNSSGNAWPQHPPNTTFIEKQSVPLYKAHRSTLPIDGPISTLGCST